MQFESPEGADKVSKIVHFLRNQSAFEDPDQHCWVFINELNSGSPGIIQNQNFIELFVYWTSENKKRMLQGYKLIGISGGFGASEKMTIDLVVNMWNRLLYDTENSSSEFNVKILTIDEKLTNRLKKYLDDLVDPKPAKCTARISFQESSTQNRSSSSQVNQKSQSNQNSVWNCQI